MTSEANPNCTGELSHYLPPTNPFPVLDESSQSESDRGGGMGGGDRGVEPLHSEEQEGKAPQYI